MIVADTGAIIALIDADDAHHDEMIELFEEDPAKWVLPWAILPEVDYLVGAHISERAQRAFVRDIATEAFTVEWGEHRDIERARKLCDEYRSLKLGLVDAVVAATAERLRATAIATVDLRDFAPLKLAGSPKLLPRDK